MFIWCEVTIDYLVCATDNTTTLISEEKKDGSGIESVGVKVGSDVARDDCMTTEIKAEEGKCEGRDRDSYCVGKIGSGESVVVWE